MSKPKVAIFDFACCEGCQLQIVNMEGELLEMLTQIDPVEWREAMSDQSEVYDVAIIEGSITREEDAEKLRIIRERASIVIALGACATMGGVNKLANNFTRDDLKQHVYGESAFMPHLKTDGVRAIDEVVKVDHKVEGCPIDASELAHAIRSLLSGKKPHVPDYPVCVECKMRENCCRYEYDEICLGPVTRAGCNARCPSNGFWCFGCRGPVPDPNTHAAKEIMAHYGKSYEDLKSKMALFGGQQEFTHV